MKVVFLDVDGVLNNSRTNSKTPEGFVGISNTLLDRFAHFVKETNAKIVLTSTWKEEWDKNPKMCAPDGAYLARKLRQKGVHILDKTDESSTGAANRGAAIKLYLESHPEIKEFVVLDDNEFDFYKYPEIAERFVHTNGVEGFTNLDMEKATAILRDEDMSRFEEYEQ